MKAVIRLEMIADDYFWHVKRGLWDFKRQMVYMRRLGTDKSPSWLAKLTWDGDRMKREFQHGTRDYSRANSCGSRGIFTYYPLGDGVYEVNDRYKWSKVRRYFVEVKNGEIREISMGEAARVVGGVPDN